MKVNHRRHGGSGTLHCFCIAKDVPTPAPVPSERQPSVLSYTLVLGFRGFGLLVLTWELPLIETHNGAHLMRVYVESNMPYAISKYDLRKQQQRCPRCGASVEAPRIYCERCKQAGRQYHAAKESERWAQTQKGAFIAHCGVWHALNSLPFLCPSCGTEVLKCEERST